MAKTLRARLKPWEVRETTILHADGTTTTKSEPIIFQTEEDYAKAMNAYFEERYAGLSHPVIGTEIYEMEPPEWALENLIQHGGLTMLHGKPGSGKSLMAMDWAYVLAHPQIETWMGQRRRRQYRPMYLFTEGIPGLITRSKAWEKSRGHSIPQGDDGVVWITQAMALNRTDDPEKPFTTQVTALRRLFDDLNCDILFIDTLANTFAGNENSQQDANNYLHTLRMFQEGGVPVVVVHHNQKEGKDYRGSTVLEGAFDTRVLVEKEGHERIKLMLKKQKDGDDTFKLDLRLKLETWEWKGEDWSSVVLEEREEVGLSPADEETIASMDTSGLTAAELAEIMDLPVTTVDGRLKRLTARGVIDRLGSGGKGDPYRYRLQDQVEEL